MKLIFSFFCFMLPALLNAKMYLLRSTKSTQTFEIKPEKTYCKVDYGKLMREGPPGRPLKYNVSKSKKHLDETEKIHLSKKTLFKNIHAYELWYENIKRSSSHEVMNSSIIGMMSEEETVDNKTQKKVYHFISGHKLGKNIEGYFSNTKTSINLKEDIDGQSLLISKKRTNFFEQKGIAPHFIHMTFSNGEEKLQLCRSFFDNDGILRHSRGLCITFEECKTQ